MKITLRDFGPISHFEFDLEKDLHVIFGKNNIGKSYAISSVYLILKNIIEEYNQFNSRILDRHYYAPIINNTENTIINEFQQQKIQSVDISEKIKSTFSGIIEGEFAQKLGNSLNNSFAGINRLSNNYSKRAFTLQLQYSYFTITISCNEKLNLLYVSDLKINLNVIVRLSDGNKDSFFSNTEHILYYGNKKNNIGVADSIGYLYRSFGMEILDYVNNIYFLPASRSGLYQGLNSFSQIVAELSKNRNYITRKIELPGLTEPVADYYLNLTNINNNVKNEFDEIIESIENDILKGKVFFNEETKKIVFKQVEINTEFDLSFTSSMVSEISPIVAFLKYIISTDLNNKSSIIFIEEPEAHLHPEIQVKLIEIFSGLIRKNIKIVMTSHSNYMFNELSNLLLENKIDHNKVSSYLMRATDKGSVTDMLSMKAEAEGMNDENFADVAEKLYDERIKIYERLNKEAKNVD